MDHLDKANCTRIWMRNGDQDDAEVHLHIWRLANIKQFAAPQQTACLGGPVWNYHVKRRWKNNILEFWYVANLLQERSTSWQSLMTHILLDMNQYQEWYDTPFLTVAIINLASWPFFTSTSASFWSLVLSTGRLIADGYNALGKPLNRQLRKCSWPVLTKLAKPSINDADSTGDQLWDQQESKHMKPIDHGLMLY